MSFFRRCVRWILVVLLLFVSLTKAIEWTTEAWFFESVGQIAVYQRMMEIRITLFAFGVAWSVLLLWLNLRHARRVLQRHADSPVGLLMPPRDKSLLDRYRRFWAGVPLLFAVLLCGSGCAQNWLVVIRCFASAPSGTRDPIFGRDIAFYLFTLPALNFAWTFLNSTLWLTLAVTTLFYAYENIIQIAVRPLRIAPEALKHLAALCVALLLWKATGYQLSEWNLLTARGAPLGGLDWTSLHVQVPVCALLSLLALTAAWFLHRSARRGQTLEACRVSLFFLAASIALGTLLPLAVRTFYADPHRVALEMPLLQMRRAATAHAFGLENVRSWPQNPASDADLRAVAEGFPTWRERELLAYLNAHERHGDYVFTALQFDTYEINGEQRPVFVAAREPLPAFDNASDWHSAHGFGALICDAARRTPEGAPLIYQATLVHSEIVFSELPDNSRAGLLTVPTNPLPDVMTRTVRPTEAAAHAILPSDYQGAGGIALDSALRRRFLAWRFGDFSVLQAPHGARVAWHRRIAERCAAIAPFLLFDEPHFVVTKSGRLIWLLNAHSVADSYPLAEALSGTQLNSLHCAALASVDAFDGSVTFYAADETDPLLNSYRKLFPSLFRPWNSLPQELRVHVPYSKLLFGAQSEVWARMLAPSPQELLKGEKWQIAALLQPSFWGSKAELYLSSQSTFAADKLVQSQIFTQPQAPNESVLNGPIVGTLAGSLDRNRKSYRPLLWQWRPPKPLALPLKASVNVTEANFTVPQTLLAAPVGDSLLLRYTESREGRLGSDHEERERWIVANPQDKNSESSFAQGNTLDSALAGWWLNRGEK